MGFPSVRRVRDTGGRPRGTIGSAVVRTAAYASLHSGRPPPWCIRDVEVVVPGEVAHRIRREVTRLGADGGRFTIRRSCTIVVWSGGEPVGSVTMGQDPPPGGPGAHRPPRGEHRAGRPAA